MGEEEYIKKSKETYQKGLEFRSQIIVRAIDIEILLDEVLALYFISAEKQMEFKMKFLSDSLFNIALKRSILQRLNLFKKYPSFHKDLERIFTIRNYAAHSSPVFSTDFPKIYNDKTHKLENFENLFKEFEEKRIKAYNVLKETYLILLRKSQIK